MAGFPFKAVFIEKSKSGNKISKELTKILVKKTQKNPKEKTLSGSF